MFERKVVYDYSRLQYDFNIQIHHMCTCNRNVFGFFYMDERLINVEFVSLFKGLLRSIFKNVEFSSWR